VAIVLILNIAADYLLLASVDLGLGAGMDVAGPQVGDGGMPVALGAGRAVEGKGGAVRVEGAVRIGEGGIEAIGDLHGDFVVDFPEGADDVWEAGELEGCGEVDGVSWARTRSRGDPALAMVSRARWKALTWSITLAGVRPGRGWLVMPLEVSRIASLRWAATLKTTTAPCPPCASSCAALGGSAKAANPSRLAEQDSPGGFQQPQRLRRPLRPGERRI
jgi:hypothetical protein